MTFKFVETLEGFHIQNVFIEKYYVVRWDKIIIKASAYGKKLFYKYENI